MDAILDKYEAALNDDKRINVTLAKIYGEMFDVEVTQSTFAMFGAFCKVYNKNDILLALLDMYGMENLDHNRIGLLISYFLKKRLEEKNPVSNNTNLNIRGEELYRQYGRI